MKKWLVKNKKGIIFILLSFVVWQLFLTLVIDLGLKFIPSPIHYIYTDPLGYSNPKFLWRRGNFDGAHYLEIARRGYGAYQQAFFPLYPNLIKQIAPILGGKDLLAGLIISWISFLFALFFLYKLVLIDFEEKIAKRAILFLLFFPSSFFFVMAYTESLFLLFVLSSFILLGQKNGFWLVY